MNRRHSFPLAGLGLVTALCLATGCSSDSKSGGTGSSAAVTTAAPTAAPSTAAATTIADTAADAPITTDATRPETEDTGSGTATPATDPAPPETPASTVPATDAPTTEPDIVQRVPGLAAIELTATGDDPQRPTFSWTPPAGATSYQLVVQDAAGTPIWAWTGAATTIGLGGDALPAAAEGPTLSGPGRARVYALDAAASVIAVSPWLALPGA